VPTTLLPYFLLFHPPNWCTLSPNSPIEKKEISNDRTRPMKADQGFYSLAKRAHYSASITEAKAMRPIDQPKSILIKGPVYIARVIFTSPPDSFCSRAVSCQSMVVFGDVMTIASVPSGWCLFSRRKENGISYHPSIS